MQPCASVSMYYPNVKKALCKKAIKWLISDTRYITSQVNKKLSNSSPHMGGALFMSVTSPLL